MATDSTQDASARNWFARALRGGLPAVLVAAFAAAAVIALLISANERTTSKPVAYAEFSAKRNGCAIEASRSYNVRACTVVGRRTFALTFLTSLRHTSPLVSEGSCCAGAVGASVTNDNTVIVAFPRLRGEVRATVVLP
jgi:hypothetical protein